MRRALGQFWPRAESKLYEEPKKLVAHGLATATKESTGRRPRTVYSITAKGRRAMAEWVPQPGAGPVMEFEGLVKLFYAEHGSRADVLATLANVQAWVDEQHEASVGISRGYLDGEGPFPERLPWLILCGQFLEELHLTVERWMTWAKAEVEQWPDDLRDAEPAWDVLEAQAERNEAWLASRPGA
jgi:DNA-binding PadR family transcriptional regulator